MSIASRRPSGMSSTSGLPRSSATSTSRGRSTRTRPPTDTSVARSSPGRPPIASTRSAAPSAPEVLSGPVAVCLDRPVLALDTPFTYDLPAELGAGVGSLVRVRFHGKLTRGWVLGPTDDVPARVLPVQRLVSPTRAFDAPLLRLYQWMSERYVAPLATVIGRASPPRVASEEEGRWAPGTEGVGPGGSGASGASGRSEAPPGVTASVAAHGSSPWSGYIGGAELAAAVADPSGAGFVVRTAPGDEVELALEAVRACLAAGRRAIVLVPDASPVPATAAALRETFGERVGVLL